MVKNLAVALVLAGSSPVVVHAQPTAVEAPRTLTLAERAYFAAEVHTAVKRYFAHQEGLPQGFDFDAVFRAYLSEAMSARDRREVSVATSRLFASLGNGHTFFTDRSLSTSAGRTPFHAVPVEGRWTVLRSRLPDLHPGDVIVAVDGVAVETWLRPIAEATAASSTVTRDRLLFRRTVLLPQRYRLRLLSGRTVVVDRALANYDLPMRGRVTPTDTQVERRLDGVVVIRVPSFAEARFEDAAVQAVRENAAAPAIIIDVRGNGGGNTPSKLLQAIMTAPYRGTLVATPMTLAVLDARAVFEPNGHPFPRGMVRSGPELRQPEAGAYAGRVAVLADGDCGSACDDFVLRFKDGRRGVVIGETTVGSTGQPYYRDFPELGLAFGVSIYEEGIFSRRRAT